MNSRYDNHIISGIEPSEKSVPDYMDKKLREFVPFARMGIFSWNSFNQQSDLSIMKHSVLHVLFLLVENRFWQRIDLYEFNFGGLQNFN